MPNRTVYINKQNDEQLQLEESVSGLVNELLSQHYGLPVSEPKPPKEPKLGPPMKMGKTYAVPAVETFDVKFDPRGQAEGIKLKKEPKIVHAPGVVDQRGVDAFMGKEIKTGNQLLEEKRKAQDEAEAAQLRKRLNG